MPCYSPGMIPHPWADRKEGLRMQVPCGRCIGCLLQRGRDWTVRCLHEARNFEFNYFLTLTYRDDQLHQYLAAPSLNPPDVTRFWKRVRKAGFKVRYLYCGEYGEVTGRPHYHAIAFNFPLDDLKLYTERNGNRLYTSARLDALWTHGQCVVGMLTPETVSYTCGYTLKKLYGPDATTYYAQRGQVPPFIRMSRKPGIGYDHVSRYSHDLSSQDFVYLNSDFKSKVPRYYEKLLDRSMRKLPTTDPTPALRSLRRMGETLSDVARANSVPHRLAVRHAVALAKYAQRPSAVF